MVKLDLENRELDVIIDAVITRNDYLTDLIPFSLSPLAVKLRCKELTKLTDKLRVIRDENKVK